MEKIKSWVMGFVGCLCISVLLAMPLISAQEIEADSGITPDSAFYGLDIALENIRMTFTLGNENKINYGLKRAEERLSELREVSTRSDVYETESQRLEALNRVENLRQEHIEDIQNRIEELDSEEIKNKVENNIQRHIDVLKGILEDAPEEARRGLETAIENSQRQIDAIKNIEISVPFKPEEQKQEKSKMGENSGYG